MLSRKSIAKILVTMGCFAFPLATGFIGLFQQTHMQIIWFVVSMLIAYFPMFFIVTSGKGYYYEAIVIAPQNQRKAQKWEEAVGLAGIFAYALATAVIMCGSILGRGEWSHGMIHDMIVAMYGFLLATSGALTLCSWDNIESKDRQKHGIL